MKTRLFAMFMSLMCCVSWGRIFAAEEKSALPLPNSGNVTLSLDEYNRLTELAAKPAKKPDVAPLAYSIKHADVKLKVENDSVVGTLQLDGEVFRKGVSKVPLTSGMTILDAHQNGKGVPLEQENGTHVALLAGPADFSIELNTGLLMRIDAGRASFSLPVPSAGSVQLSLVIPGDHTLANISPGLITSRKSESGHTVIEATLVPGQPVNIWWATRETAVQAVPREVRYLADAKTLISVSESEMRVEVLTNISVVQGDPSEFQIEVPAGYEITGVTGPTVDSNEMDHNEVDHNQMDRGVLTVKINDPGERNHQFLISMERAISGAKADAPILAFKKAQRETGEVLVEGAGTMEITATEGGGLKRMDVKEASPYLRSLAHYPTQAAFRYHKQPSESPTLALEWVRFPDGSVLAAVAENATVTTLVTSEGKSLTEVKLTLKNQAQPFLKVALPAGATILSAEVAGERVKPVQGPDGSRVPLLRAGFRPTDAYEVSFVFLHSGAPFAKKGGAELSLPGMDIPISLLNWEVFLPDQYKVKDFGGDVIAANLVPTALHEQFALRGQPITDEASVVRMQTMPGQMGGYVVDPSGAVVPSARVTITSPSNGINQTTSTDNQGRWVVGGIPSGSYKAKVEMPGFKAGVWDVNYDSNQPSMYSFQLNVGGATQTVEVAGSLQMQGESANFGGAIFEKELKSTPVNGRSFSQLVALSPGAANQNQASANVQDLQRRVAGVLPVAVTVPRTGTSFAFVRPLVLDEETKVTFSYKSR